MIASTPLSVTCANPDTDLPETKLCFLHVSECPQCFSPLSCQFITSNDLAASIYMNSLAWMCVCVSCLKVANTFTI